MPILHVIENFMQTRFVLLDKFLLLLWRNYHPFDGFNHCKCLNRLLNRF